MKVLIAPVICFFVLGVAMDVESAIIVGYRSMASDEGLEATEWLNGVTPERLERGGGIGRASGNTFNSRGWDQDTEADAFSAGDYLEWGWQSEQALLLDELELKYDRSSSGPRRLSLLARFDASPDWHRLFEDMEVADDSSDQHQISLTDWSGITSATFRLVGWDAGRTSGTFDIENFGPDEWFAVSVSGTPDVAPVPEPSSWLGWAAAMTVGISLTLRKQCLSRSQPR